MKERVSLLKLTSKVNIFLGVMNFLISAALCSKSDMIIEEHIYYIHDVTPKNYYIKLTLNQEKQREKCKIYFTGECDIEVMVHFRMDHITLNSDKSTINLLSVSMVPIAETTDEPAYDVKEIVYNITRNFVTIYFTRRFFGIHLLKLRYDVCLSESDVFKISYTNETKMSILMMYFLPTRAKALFPCFDDLRLKANFNITLIMDENYNAVSNGEKQSILYIRQMATISFAQVQNITTYDIAIVIYEKFFLTYKLPLIWYRIEAEKDGTFLQTMAFNITEYLLNHWNLLYTHPMARIFVIRGLLQQDSMTKPGVNIYREEAILCEAGKDSLMTQVGVSRLIARTTVHEILNNIVKPISWDSLWINEGIAMLLGQHIVNKYFPKLRLFDLFIVQFHQESLRLQSIIGPVKPIIHNGTNINSLFSFSHYLKAPVILNMLRRVISDEIFWKGVQNYLTNYTDGSLDNLVTAMEQSMEDSGYMPIRLMMSTWTNEMEKNMIYITTDYLTVNIEPIGILKLIIYPLTMTTQSDLNFELYNSQILSGYFEVEKNYDYNALRKRNENDWIIFNLQQLGYYRVMYENQNWQKIANYMNDNYTKIHVLNRAQIVDDTFHFLIKQQMELTMFLNLTNFLKLERDYVVWYPMFKGFEYISSYFAHEHSDFIKNKFAALTEKFFLNVAVNVFTNGEIDNCLTQEMVKWSCIFGCQYCKNVASTFLQRYIRDKGISPLWKDWIYCKGLMKNDVAIWDQLFNIFLNGSSNEMLRYLACSGNPDIVLRYMNKITNDTEIGNIIANKGDKTSTNIFHSIVERHSRDDRVLTYILDNFDSVVPRDIGTLVALTDIINHIYIPRYLLKVAGFVNLSNAQPFEWIIKKTILRATQIDIEEQFFSHLKRKE